MSKLVSIWRTSHPLRESHSAGGETKEDEGICPESYNKSVQEMLEESGTSWLWDGFFLITSVIDCTLIATYKERNSDFAGLEEVLLGIMYMLGFLPNLHIILIDGFVCVVPWNFNVQVSKSYVLICKSGPILGLILVLLCWLILLIFFNVLFAPWFVSVHLSVTVLMRLS